MNERDQVFTFNGKRLLIDTHVLPTIRCSLNLGRDWTEGYGLTYLLEKLGQKMDLETLKALDKSWGQFCKDFSTAS